MSQPVRPSFPTRPRKAASNYLGILKVAATIGAVLLLFYWLTSGGKPEPVAQAPPGTTPESARNVELATVASVQRQQLLAAKLMQREAIATFDELSRDIREWEKELTAWQAEGPPLMGNDQGKKLAADPDLARQVRIVLKEERPGIQAIQVSKKLSDELIFPVRESLKNAEDASSPSSYATDKLRTLQSEARNARERYRQARETVSALIAQASAPGAKTLEQTLADIDREESLQRIATIEAAEKKARDEASRLVAEEKAKVIQAEGEATAQKLRDEAALKKQSSELAAAKAVEEMKLKDTEAAQERTRLQDLNEQKRQGELKTGSVWKGEFGQMNIKGASTLTILTRVKDDVHVVLKNTQTGIGGPTYTFQGSIQGNRLRLKSADGITPFDLDATYTAATQAISGKLIDGGGSSVSFSVRLDKGE